MNPLALGRAAASMLMGGRRLGGSTITMQMARLRHTLQTTSISGKLRQMWYSFLYERHYSKNEILEAYFTLAPYGGNVEGIGAAVRVYFHADAGRLSLGQALALTPVPQNPVHRSPVRGVSAAVRDMPQDTAGRSGEKAVPSLGEKAASGKTQAGAGFASARQRMHAL